MSRPWRHFSRSAAAAHAEEIVIKIENFTFNPAEITIKPGTTVTWQNGDDIPHSVVEATRSFVRRLSTRAKNSPWHSRMQAEISYFCGLHPHMKGKIIVKP